MSVVPQVTCRQCGQKFSSLHSRCPHCGTRYVKQTSRSTPTTASENPESAAAAQAGVNARWQMIFGAVLVVAVIVAVIILVTASLNAPSEPKTPASAPPQTEDIPATEPPPTQPPATPTPTVPVSSITIVTSYDGKQVSNPFTQRTTWQPIDLDAEVYPRDALNFASVEWRSTDEAVCTVDKDGVVTAMGSGSCEIIAECGGVAARVTVLVP